MIVRRAATLLLTPLLILATVALGAPSAQAAPADPCNPGQNARGWVPKWCTTATWMGRVYATSPQVPLSEMLIPGTHDSGAYAIRDRKPCRPQVIAGAGAVFTLAAQENPCTAAALARAQTRDLRRQLRDGIRYLDIRVGVPADKIISKPRKNAANPLRVPLVLQHNYVSERLTTGLRQVLRFAQQHPREVVILDFQHIDLIGDPAIDRYYYAAVRGVLQKLRAPGMPDTVCSRAWTRRSVGAAPAQVSDVPIRRAWRAQRNLVVLMDADMPRSGCFYDRDRVISSPWPNTDVPEVSRVANVDYLAERRDRLRTGNCTDGSGVNWCGLFVNQLQLTPSNGLYANCVFNRVGDACSLAALAGLVNDRIPGYLTKWTRQGKPTNISIVDYFQNSAPSYVDRLIRINRLRAG